MLTLPADLTPLKVVSDYLRFLKDFTLAKLNVQWGSNQVTAADVMWAMTVPAAWSEAAKQLMREAAVMSGLVPNAGSRSVASHVAGSADIMPEI